MNAASYAFVVGDIECIILLDGAPHHGKDWVIKHFPDVSEADCRQAYAEMGLSLDEADNSFNILLLKIGEETVLVDAGLGIKPVSGYLPERMVQAGIEPEAVTLVVLTHSHGDHVLGMLSGSGEATFPNASYVISKAEMDFWQALIENGSLDQNPIISMMEEKGLRLIDMDEQIMPGLIAFPIPGHTPGQIALLVESEGEKLIHMADLLHSPMQFAHPEWSPNFDADTSVSIPTRRKALGLAADENLLTLFYHLTFPGLGRVKRAGEGFLWEPAI
jgi:glyoxylase-like metal-dependent hydrolase (beta-lactamase superfamily II)